MANTSNPESMREALAGPSSGMISGRTSPMKSPLKGGSRGEGTGTNTPIKRRRAATSFDNSAKTGLNRKTMVTTNQKRVEREQLMDSDDSDNDETEKRQFAIERNARKLIA